MINYQPTATDFNRLFHAIADPTRRRIVERLARGPAAVTELAGPFAMTLPAILKHLQVLENSGLIRSEKVGRVRVCRFEPATMRVAEQWMAERCTAWERQLDRLGEFLAETGADDETDSKENS